MLKAPVDASQQIPKPPKPEVAVDPRLDKIFAMADTAVTEDQWKKIARELTPTIKALASGDIHSTAGQASILKHIMDRAYGKVSKAQEDARGPNGVVVLPTTDNNMTMQLCPICVREHSNHGNQ